MASISSKICCTNTRPIPSTSCNSPRRSTQVSWGRKEGSWRIQCVAGMACLMFSLENVKLKGVDEQKIIVNAEPVIANAELVVESKKNIATQWSDQRRCEPWLKNSLETVVPENLPRPSAHRRWEQVHYKTNHKAQAQAAVKLLLPNKCFTM